MGVKRNGAAIDAPAADVHDNQSYRNEMEMSIDIAVLPVEAFLDLRYSRFDGMQKIFNAAAKAACFPFDRRGRSRLSAGGDRKTAIPTPRVSEKPPMSIRRIARELYQLQKEVEALEQDLEQAPYDRKEEIEEKLRRARAARDRMKNVLDGQKDSRR